MIWAVARRELGACFLSPIAWTLLAAGQLVLAWVFLSVLEGFSGLEAARRGAGLGVELGLNLFGMAAVVSLLAMPLLAARSLSGEMRDGTFELLGCAPVSLAAVLLGKLLGLAAIAGALALLPLLMGLALAAVAEVDPGLLAAAALGVWLAGVLFAAVGLFSASLTTQPGLAAVVAYGILVALSVLQQGASGGGAGATLFEWLSWNEHLLWFLLGVVRSGDLLYFALLGAFFLALAHRRMANRRLD